MSGQSVKHLALGVVRSQVPDKCAFGGVFPQLFKVRVIILHRTALPLFPDYSRWNKSCQFLKQNGNYAAGVLSKQWELGVAGMQALIIRQQAKL
jgi:hypothetical protein